MSKINRLVSSITKLVGNPTHSWQHITRYAEIDRARKFVSSAFQPAKQTQASHTSDDPLTKAFDANQNGHGIWKWRHYMPLYHRHLQKFMEQPCTFMEVGIFSGGSLKMWQEYLGPKSRIIGVDIEPACTNYKRPGIDIYIGDQADRAFWSQVWANEASVDVVLDDGGHTPEQMMVTLEETLPKLNAGGVYICEDIHGRNQPFWTYVGALVAELSAYDRPNTALLQSKASPFQQAIYSIHCYPFAVVVERTTTPVDAFTAPRHGTEWQPFL